MVPLPLGRSPSHRASALRTGIRTLLLACLSWNLGRQQDDADGRRDEAGDDVDRCEGDCGLGCTFLCEAHGLPRRRAPRGESAAEAGADDSLGRAAAGVTQRVAGEEAENQGADDVHGQRAEREGTGRAVLHGPVGQVARNGAYGSGDADSERQCHRTSRGSTVRARATPIQVAPVPITSVASAYRTAVATCPSLTNRSPSTAKVDIVVHAPSTPTQKNGRTYLAAPTRSSSVVSTRPNRNAPETLIVNVVHGNRPAAVGHARPSSYRPSAPRNPPAATAASTST